MIKSKAFFANLNTKIEWFKKRIIKKLIITDITLINIYVSIKTFLI